jgi:DNA-binding phage protein
LIAEAAVIGANKTKIAEKYGVSRETLYKYIKTNSELDSANILDAI